MKHGATSPINQFLYLLENAVPDATVSRPRRVRISSQMRSFLDPDAIKNIGLELRRIMRPSSTVEARKRWQRKNLRNAVLENRISELQECFGIQCFWDWQKVHGVKDWRHLYETAPKTNTSQDKACFPIRCSYASPSSSCRSDSNSITTKGETSNYANGIPHQYWRGDEVKKVWIPNSVKDVFTNEVLVPEDNDIATTENVAHVAMLLFAGYIDAATSMSKSCGGGGSAPSSGWGKKDDEDDWKFAHRCAQMAHSMCKPKPRSRSFHR